MLNKYCDESCSPVFSLAKEYQISAELCCDHRQLQSAVLLSALAIEIGLKSFISKRVKTKIGENKYIINSGVKGKRTHDLVGIFNKIDPQIRREIENEYFKIKNESFKEKIEKYSFYFTNMRYRYEKGSVSVISSETVEFSSVFLVLAENIHLNLAPKIIKPTPEQLKEFERYINEYINY